MAEIAVIGQGNVADYFSKELNACRVNSRTLESLPRDAKLYIIAVSDNAINEVAKRLPVLEGIVAHTSGTIGLDALTTTGVKNAGVLYPLQTITKGYTLTADQVPVLIEGSNREIEDYLVELVSSNGHPYKIASSQQRRKMHLRATIANNFTNHLLALATEDMEDAKLLKPLIEQTITKGFDLGFAAAQTGAARRGDTLTLDKHLSLLPPGHLREIYQAITSSLLDYYKK